MKNSVVALVACCGLVSSLMADGSIEIPNAAAPRLIDGRLDDECWDKAYRTGPFCSLMADSPVRYDTEALICRDRQNLYVAVICHSESAAAIEEEASRQTTRPWGGDHIEVFIDPGESGNVVQIAVDAAGTLAFPLVAKPIRFGVQVRDDAWTCEMQIPFDSPKIGAGPYSPNWSFNVTRGNESTKEYATWAKLQNGVFNDPMSFHRIKLLDIDLEKIRARQQVGPQSDFDVQTDRIIYMGQQEMKVRLNVDYRQPMKGFHVAARLFDTNGCEVSKGESRKVFFTTDFAVPFESVKNGCYRLDVRLLDGDGKSVRNGSVHVWKVPSPISSLRKTKWEIRNQILYRNNEVFLPIITYLTTTNEQDLVDARDHGFNMLAFGRQGFLDESYERLEKMGPLHGWESPFARAATRAGIRMQDMLDLYAKYGMYAIPEVPYLGEQTPDHIDAFVSCFLRSRSADQIAFWYLSDETDADVQGNALRHRLCKEIDPLRLTYLSLIRAIGPNKDNADIISADPYPFYYTKSNPCGVAAACENLVRCLRRPTQTQFVWLQNFGEGVPNRGWRPPTPAEVRVQAFLAMNHGAKGIGWFVFQQRPERRKLYWQDPDAWEEMGRVNRELLAHTKMFLLGTRFYAGKQGSLDVAAYKWNGKTHVSVVNTSDQPVKDVLVQIPGLANRRYSLPGYWNVIETR